MREASGRYHGAGWVVDLSQGRLGPAARLVTVHEAMHDRLQFTTMYGLLVQVLWAVGDATGEPSWTERADEMLLGAARVHEEFASWMTEQLAGPGLSQLRNAYPAYAGHADRATGRADGHNSDYARLHAINGIYRSCMQSVAAAEATARPLGDLLTETVPRAGRPDHRLRVLTAALNSSGWKRLPSLENAQTLEDYANEDDGAWESVSRVYYEYCASLLDASGCPTLPYEGQLAHVDRLHEQAVVAARGPIRLVPASASTEGPESDEDVVLRAMESETVRLRDPQPCTVLPADTPVEDLTSGRGTGRHLFLAIRPAGRLTPLYEPVDGALGDGTNVAVLRGTTHEHGQRTVALLDVTHRDPRHLFATGLPVVTSISMRSLADDETRARWAPALTVAASTVLVDLSPTRHLRLWLTDQTHTARLAIVGYRAAEREVTAVIWQLESSTGGLSRLHIAVVSPTFPAALEVWFASQSELSGRIVRDDGLADRNDELLGITMGHLLAEEGTFDFMAGDRR